jgi:PAS domain S-box-containing protein
VTTQQYGQSWQERDARRRRQIDEQTARRLLGSVGTLTLGGALLTCVLTYDIPRAHYLAMVISQGLVGLACLAAMTRVTRLALRPVVLATTWAAWALLVELTWFSQLGSWGLALNFVPLLVCAQALLVGPRPAIAMAVTSTAHMGLLVWAEQAGWLRGAAAIGPGLAVLAPVNHLLLLLAGLAAGALVLRWSNLSYDGTLQRESRFRALLSMAAAQYWETDRTLRIVRCESAQASDPAWSSRLRCGTDLAELVSLHAVDAQVRDATLLDLAAGRPVTKVLIHLPDAQGGVHLRLSGQARLDPHGRTDGYWGVVHDATAEVRQQQEARATSAMLGTTFDASPDGLMVTEFDGGRILMCNQPMLDMLGLARHEALGRSTAELGIWQNPHERDRLMEALRNHGRVDGLRAQARNRLGPPHTLRLSSRLYELNGQIHTVTSARDVTHTDRLQFEMRTLLERAPVGIAVTRQGRLVTANHSFERMMGWSAQTRQGRPLTALDEGATRPSGLPALMQSWPWPDAELPHEARIGRTDGSSFWCRMHAAHTAPQDSADDAVMWIAEDVSEPRRQAEELARARDTAEAAVRAKARLLATTTHEIRTPLNAVVALLRLARQPGLGDPQRLAFLQQIDGSARTLVQVVDDILDWSKIEAGKLCVQPQPFALQPLLERLLQNHRGLAQVKGLTLGCDCPPDLPVWVLGDDRRLAQVLGNYVSNALKFTDTGSVELEVRRGAGPDTLEFSVRDSGIGMNAAQLGRLFQPFSQADDATARLYGGTGLGLSICRELSQLMGGEVGCESRPGQGSRFWLRLPLPAAACPEATPRPAATPPAESVPPMPERALVGMRVLLAEDNPVNQTVMQLLLDEWDVAHVLAPTGTDAVAMTLAAQTGPLPFDVVLMDNQMPGCSGLEATRQLVQTLGPRCPPIIGLSAAVGDDERRAGLQAGMVEYLDKPIDPDRLLAVLRRCRTGLREAA